MFGFGVYFLKWICLVGPKWNQCLSWTQPSFGSFEEVRNRIVFGNKGKKHVCLLEYEKQASLSPSEREWNAGIELTSLEKLKYTKPHKYEVEVLVLSKDMF